MKGKTLLAIGLIALIAGIAIIIYHTSITSHGVVITGGVLFMAVGLANLIIYGQKSHETNAAARAFNQITNAASIVLGICMLVFESTFVPLVSFIFGLLVAVCAVWQFFLLAVGARPYQLPGWLYAYPVLLSISAIYIFSTKSIDDKFIMLITGVSFALLGVACVCEGVALGHQRHKTLIETRQSEKETKEESALGQEEKKTASGEDATEEKH